MDKPKKEIYSQKDLGVHLVVKHIDFLDLKKMLAQDWFNFGNKKDPKVKQINTIIFGK